MENNFEQKIKERAYEIWQHRQEFCMEFIVDNYGHIREITAEDDWLEAEKEVRQ